MDDRSNEIPLTDREYLLCKFPGKGGWTYAEIPEVVPDPGQPFGWVKVKGSIDGFNFMNYRIMPMGNGNLFFPVKAAIRKEIGKKDGDYVRIILYRDDAPIEVPEELMLSLQTEPGALEKFSTLSEGLQKQYIEWIYSSRTEDTKVERIVDVLKKLSRS